MMIHYLCIVLSLLWICTLQVIRLPFSFKKTFGTAFRYVIKILLQLTLSTPFSIFSILIFSDAYKLKLGFQDVQFDISKEAQIAPPPILFTKHARLVGIGLSTGYFVIFRVNGSLVPNLNFLSLPDPHPYNPT